MSLVSPILAPHLAVRDTYGAMLMLSQPPAIMISASPDLMICAAKSHCTESGTADLVERHGRNFLTGMPAAMETCLATFCPSPPCSTHPKTTSSTISAEIPALLIASFTATAPNVTAGVSFRCAAVTPYRSSRRTNNNNLSHNKPPNQPNDTYSPQ